MTETTTTAPTCCPTMGDLHNGHPRPVNTVRVTFSADMATAPPLPALMWDVRNLLAAALTRHHDLTADRDVMGPSFHLSDGITVRVEAEAGTYLDHDCDGAWSVEYRDMAVLAFVERVPVEAVDRALRDASEVMVDGGTWPTYLDGWGVADNIDAARA